MTVQSRAHRPGRRRRIRDPAIDLREQFLAARRFVQTVGPETDRAGSWIGCEADAVGFALGKRTADCGVASGGGLAQTG